MNHESQRVTPTTYESAVARSAYEVAMRQEAAAVAAAAAAGQMIRPPHPYDVRGIHPVYDPHAIARGVILS